jgi:chromosomal replication initiation ATPase DnaA
MRGVSPTAHDRMLGFNKPRLIPVAQFQEAQEEVKRDKLAKLEQDIADIKAENDALRDLIKPVHLQAFRPQKVAQLVARTYGFKLSDLRGASRAQGVVIARHHAMWLLHLKFKYLSLPAIGRMFGDRDHTTVLYAIKRHPVRVVAGWTRPDPDLSWLDEAA